MATQTGDTFGYLALGPHPRIIANSNPFGSAQIFTGLSGISYPVNS